MLALVLITPAVNCINFENLKIDSYNLSLSLSYEILFQRLI